MFQDNILIIDTDVVNDVTCTSQSVIIRVWSYDFYDKTLSTEQRRRHVINVHIVAHTGFSNIIDKFSKLIKTRASAQRGTDTPGQRHFLMYKKQKNNEI